jgi:hypothetical protein
MYEFYWKSGDPVGVGLFVEEIEMCSEVYGDKESVKIL